jgi:hypothetical protein
MNMFDQTQVIGIDFGDTIFYKREDHSKIIFDNAVRVILRMTDDPYTTVHIISRVNEEQEARGIKWMAETGFLEQINLPREHVHFCRERKDKATIARALKVTHHIDDRPEVMAYMDVSIYKYLFRPNPDDLTAFYNELRKHHVKVVKTWLELENEFFPPS